MPRSLLSVVLAILSSLALAFESARRVRFSRLSELADLAFDGNFADATIFEARGEPLVITDWDTSAAAFAAWSDPLFWRARMRKQRRHEQREKLSASIKILPRSQPQPNELAFAWACCRSFEVSPSDAVDFLLNEAEKRNVCAIATAPLDFGPDQLGDMLEDALPRTLPSFVYEQAKLKKTPSPQTQLWASTAGPVTPLHYDAYHNFFFVTVGGPKEFALVAPRHWPLASLYPHNHVAYRQSHFRGLNENLSAMAMLRHFEKTTGVTEGTLHVQLRKGEALYMPPFWLHHVTSVEATIAIASWTSSARFEVSNSAFAAKLPKEVLREASDVETQLRRRSGPPNELEIEVLRVFVSSLIEALLAAKNEASLSRFVDNVASRLEAVTFDDEDERRGEPDWLEASRDAPFAFNAQSNEVIDHAELRERVDRNRFDPSEVAALSRRIHRVCAKASRGNTQLSAKRVTQVREIAESLVATAFPVDNFDVHRKRPGSEEDSQAVRELLLASYVEILLGAVVDESNIVLFLRQCVVSSQNVKDTSGVELELQELRIQEDEESEEDLEPALPPEPCLHDEL